MIVGVIFFVYFCTPMRKRFSTILFFFILIVCSPVYAGEEIQWEDTLQEVTVVNARLQTQQQSLSSPVTTVRIKQLEQENRVTFKELSALVPNLYVPDYGSKMTSSIYMRGLGARIDNPVLGVYIDGVGIANKNSYDFDLFDIRSMRVYRGPQGTLFGRNTIGGVLQIETLSPLDWQGTRATIGYGNYNAVEGKVSHYHKFSYNTDAERTTSPEWGMGAAAYYRHTDGCFLNVYDGERVDASHEAGARVRVDGRNSRGYRNTTFLSYNFVQQGGFAYHQPGLPVNHNDYCGYNRHNLLFGTSYTFPINDYLLSGTTSYQYLNDLMQMDQDFLPLPYFTLQQFQREHSVSQEFTFRPKNAIPVHGKSAIEADYKPLTGVQISYKHNRLSAPVHFKQTGIDSLILKNANNGIHTAFPDATLVLQENDFVIASDFTTQVTDVAAYHTSCFTLGNWLLEAGVRLDFEYQKFVYLSDGLIHYKVENTPIADYRPVHSKVSGMVSLPYFEALPRVAATYRRNTEKGGWKAGLTIAEGYKAGGFNTQLFSDILQNTMMNDMMADMGVGFATHNDYEVGEVVTYKPERCLSVEAIVGGTYHIENWSLQGEVALYELEVFNQQLTTYPEKGTGRFMTNAGRSRSLGGEASGLVRWRDLTLAVSYGYTYACFVKYNNGKSDFAGKRVPFAPEHTLSANLTYAIRLKHSFFQSLNLNLNTQAVGRIFWEESNEEVQPFYALLNANITLQMKYLSLSLWGKNLTNTQYDVFRYVSMGNTFMQSGKPITFGAKLSLEI